MKEVNDMKYEKKVLIQKQETLHRYFSWENIFNNCIKYGLGLLTFFV